jgi:hypothetical protein
MDKGVVSMPLLPETLLETGYDFGRIE